MKQKIIYRETTQGAYFYVDNNSFVIDKTCFMMLSKQSDYLCKILSSNLYEYAYKHLFTSTQLGTTGYQYNKHALLKLPIPDDINFMHRLSVANEALTEEIINNYFQLEQAELDLINL